MLLSANQRLLLQQALNKAIKLDDSAKWQLEKMAGKTLRLQCTQPDFDIAIAVQDGFIELLAGDEIKNCDCHISGQAADFIALLNAEDKTAAMINSALNVKGDSQILITLQTIAQELELDIEYHLSRIIGDVPAHHLGQLGRHGQQLLQQGRPVFKRHLQEFLQQETKLIPTPDEFDRFVHSLSQTQTQLERIEAKLKMLLQKPNKD